MDYTTFLFQQEPSSDDESEREVDFPALVKAAAASVAALNPSSPVDKSALWRSPDAHPLALVMMVIDLEGDEALSWAGETLRLTLERRGIQLSNSAWIKLQAVRPLFTSLTPWYRWEVFNWVATGLTGSAPNFEYFEPSSIGAAMNAINIMRVADPKQELGEEVQKFVAALLKDAGSTFAPAPLQFAQHELENPQLRCRNCEAIHRDDRDTKCVTCSKEQLESVPYEFASVRDETSALYKEFLKRPPSELSQLPHSPAGEAAHTLLVQAAWAEEQRRVLRTQLQALR